MKHRLVRTVSPLAHSRAEVVVAGICHDSVILVAIVFCATAVILLTNRGELYKSYSMVALDLWQCKQTSSSGPQTMPLDSVYLLP